MWTACPGGPRERPCLTVRLRRSLALPPSVGLTRSPRRNGRVPCRYPLESMQPNNRWPQSPVSNRDWDYAHLFNAAFEIHADDPALGYRFIAGELAVKALGMGLQRPVTVHSDKGCQFPSRKYQSELDHHGLITSMGRVGATGDNAAMESFFALPQKNVLNSQR